MSLFRDNSMLERLLDNNRLQMELNSVPLSGAQEYSLLQTEGKGHMDIVLQCTFKVQEILTELQQGRREDKSSIKPPPSRGTRISTVHV